jgi:copper(I)-binding protein
MKGQTMPRLPLAPLFLVGLLVCAPAASAQTVTPSNAIQVSHIWSRASAVTTGAVYMTILNKSEQDDRLIGAACELAAKAELHQDMQDNGVMKMRPIDGVPINAKGLAVLKPGGMHLMLTGLKQPLAAGQSFPLTLEFEKAGRIEITVSVLKADSMGDMPGMKM